MAKNYTLTREDAGPVKGTSGMEEPLRLLLFRRRIHPCQDRFKIGLVSDELDGIFKTDLGHFFDSGKSSGYFYPEGGPDSMFKDQKRAYGKNDWIRLVLD